MNQRERMQKASSGNCAKGGRDPAAQRQRRALGNSRKGPEPSNRVGKKREKAKVRGEAEETFLTEIGIDRKKCLLTAEQYLEMKNLVIKGDADDLHEATELHKAFLAGGPSTTREEREQVRKARAAKKMFERIMLLERMSAAPPQGIPLQEELLVAEDQKEAESRLKINQEKAVIPKHTKALELHKENNALAKIRREQNHLASVAAFESNARESSKAIPSTFVHQQDPAFDARVAENRHHAGSHYHMAGTKAYLKGVRIPGIVARHSRQAAIRNGPGPGAN
eukprot:CAMPEP_0175143424 /NCGR_PEP_ID=MMETSP0087-20121206/13425_1 /TAXON_ID=136419 /ORGANISM="Unknown Unknown, Strain D1" /LENGTH=280 /DNA_ID=CAMNT_0016427493 /DNA_START=62 /DNA_END=904 /DNA_ORIENTATION=+